VNDRNGIRIMPSSQMFVRDDEVTTHTEATAAAMAVICSSTLVKLAFKNQLSCQDENLRRYIFLLPVYMLEQLDAMVTVTATRVAEFVKKDTEEDAENLKYDADRSRKTTIQRDNNCKAYKREVC